jgi:NAD(P)H-dependent FMN reductase
MLIQVITSSMREGRFGTKATHWVIDHLRRCDEMDSELVDLTDFPLPFFDALPPAQTQRDYPNEAVAKLGRAIDRADGFIVLTPEYNHGYPAVFKNAMDWTYVEWRRKPMAFVGWGSVGGARAVEQLRQVAVEFEMAPLRHAVHLLPDIMAAARQAPADDFSGFAPIEPKLKLMVDDLAWWAATLAAGRSDGDHGRALPRH